MDGDPYFCRNTPFPLFYCVEFTSPPVSSGNGNLARSLFRRSVFRFAILLWVTSRSRSVICGQLVMRDSEPSSFTARTEGRGRGWGVEGRGWMS